MRAATIRDGSISVQEHPDPVPEAGEVLVRVRAAGRSATTGRLGARALVGRTA